MRQQKQVKWRVCECVCSCPWAIGVSMLCSFHTVGCKGPAGSLKTGLRSITFWLFWLQERWCQFVGWLVGSPLNSYWMDYHKTLYKHSRSSEEPSDTPFCDQVGSGAVLEPVPALEPGLLTADELAPWPGRLVPEWHQHFGGLEQRMITSGARSGVIVTKDY